MYLLNGWMTDQVQLFCKPKSVKNLGVDYVVIKNDNSDLYLLTWNQLGLQSGLGIVWLLACVFQFVEIITGLKIILEMLGGKSRSLWDVC